LAAGAPTHDPAVIRYAMDLTADAMGRGPLAEMDQIFGPLGPLGLPR
jgi:hypothetical protein